MVAVIALVSSLVAASTVQAGLIPHHHRALSFARSAVPEGWITEIMENYDEYHTRYMALGCETKHDTAFFDLCCHPMKSNETLATARDASCDPANVAITAASTGKATSVAASSAAATTSASAPAVTNVASGDDDDEDCDDEDEGDDDEEDCDEDDGETTSVAPATSAAHTSKAAATTSAAAKPTTTKVAKPQTTSEAEASSAEPTTSAAPKPTTTPEAQPTTTKKATTTKAATSAKPTSTAASSSGDDDSGDFISGGKATFFYQDGAAGSCGNKNSDSTPLVAVQQDRMKSSLCGKKVHIINVANGKSVDAIVQDTCPGCANANSLDLSIGAFDAIGDEATGVLDIKWKFI